MTDDVYACAARAHHQLSRQAPNYEESMRLLRTQQQFRWAIDAACEYERARIVAWLRNLDDMGVAYADDFALMIERGKR